VPLALLAQRQSAAGRFGSQLVRAAPCDGTRGLGRGQLELHAHGLLPSDPTLQQGRLSDRSHRPAGLRVRARVRLRFRARVRASLSDRSHRPAGLRVRGRARLRVRASLSGRYSTLQQGRLSDRSHRPAGLQVRARVRLRVRASLNDRSHRLAGRQGRLKACRGRCPCRRGSLGRWHGEVRCVQGC